MEKRITELEIKLSLTEDLVEELNRTVYRHEQRLELLQEQLRHLHRQLEAVGERGTGESRDLRDEIPPHY